MSRKYTFLLPAYKGDFFRDALESIKSQRYENYQVIVSDDCSPDNLKEIFDEVAGDDPRFLYRRNHENIGGLSLVDHWNLLVDMCDSEYLILASDDDIYSHSFLEEIDKLTISYPRCDLFRGRAKIIDDREDATREDLLIAKYENQVEFIYGHCCADRIHCIANYVFKTLTLKNKGGFVKFPLAWGSDDATVFLMSDNGVGHTESVTFSFRCSGQNITSKGDRNNAILKATAIQQLLEFQEQFLSRIPLTSKLDIKRIERSRSAIFSGFYPESICYGAQFSTWGKLQSFMRYLDHIGYFSGRLDKIHFIWSWLKAHT